MIVKPTQNVESFLDAIARHIAPTGGWRKSEEKLGCGCEHILFGEAYWKGHVFYSDDDGRRVFFGVQLVCADSDYDDDDLNIIEEGIALLEGFDFEPNGEGDDGDEDEVPPTLRPRHHAGPAPRADA